MFVAMRTMTVALVALGVLGSYATVAFDGDVIRIEPGTYSESIETSTSLTIESASGASTVTLTVSSEVET